MVTQNHKGPVPEQGDIVWLEFDPQAGHEQAGLKPALVISPSLYNRTVGLAIFCPIISKIKGYPFEVLLPKDFKVKAAILSDQIKNLDWRIRKAKFITKVPREIFKEVIAKQQTILTIHGHN